MTASPPIPLTLKTLPWILALGALYFGYSIGLQNGLIPLVVAAIVALSTLWFGEGAYSERSGSYLALKRPGPVMRLLAVLVFLACWPALESDFLADDFAHLHLFYRLTSTEFFKLLATDFSQGIWKAGFNELRPLAALFYKFSYMMF